MMRKEYQVNCKRAPFFFSSLQSSPTESLHIFSLSLSFFFLFCLLTQSDRFIYFFSRFFLFWMTTNDHNYQERTRSRRNREDGNNSDDSLLVMDDDDIKTPLLSHTNGRSPVLREETLANQSISSLTHCHVPEDKFDFGSRNRLILVLLVCIIFMGIEIAGMFVR